MKIIRIVSIFALAFFVSGCGSYATSDAKRAPNAADASANAASSTPTRLPEQVVLTEQDITDRRYVALADISVTVRKWTIFDADPTREKVARALQEKAAELGADAVVLVRYGTVGIGMWSWGQMDGQGRAVRFP